MSQLTAKPTTSTPLKAKCVCFGMSGVSRTLTRCVKSSSRFVSAQSSFLPIWTFPPVRKFPPISQSSLSVFLNLLKCFSCLDKSRRRNWVATTMNHNNSLTRLVGWSSSIFVLWLRPYSLGNVGFEFAFLSPSRCCLTSFAPSEEACSLVFQT